MEAGHTALPWHVGDPNCDHRGNPAIGIRSAEDWVICDVWQDGVPGMKNAEFIVTACNEHAALKRKAEELDAENKELHRKLAAAELDAKTAWSRYENANSSRITTEQQLETAVCKADAVDGLVKALQEAIAVIERIKPPENGNGTIVRGRKALSAAGA